ncbi:AAA family ATPase [uncultured Mediterranea sp.]|uniref:ATP-dependent DNA helicase n=1 Tax=uncultured Mediterranea sp. TaxID=1926662 RepID=UPI0027D95539|nr:AAA family ATPase [uncultured Mediterranea sp.]
MINNYLERQIKENFPYQPTSEQENAIKLLSGFLCSPKADVAFLLRGYAGTGKTSLVGALVRTLDILKQKVVLLAPTGRAAKVFSSYAGHPAFTIHKKIYRERTYSGEGGDFMLNDNLTTHTLYIVDEASMISNEGLSGAMFGTGRLLDDLVQFVYSGQGCRLLLMGDTAQLPPVGEELSPALYTDALRGYGLEVVETDLTQVVRQEQQSGILWNATELRKLIAEEEWGVLPKIRVSCFPDVKLLPGNELIDELSACYDRDGIDETIVVCRSNKRANIYNNGIRSQILWREEELESGDILMVAKNNYYWTEKEKNLDFIANGETAVVRRVRRTSEMYGFHFADVLLSFPNWQDAELEVRLLLDTLHSDAPALLRDESERLFQTILEDYVDIPLKRDRMKKMKADPYYNALQVKYAYAVTCHKAQGGQWKNVFLDQGYLSEEYLTPDYFRWLYTAFTRATGTIYLVNYPVEQTE